MKKIIILLCSLIVAIVPIFSLNNIANSYAYVPGSPSSDLYFQLNVPFTSPIESEFYELSNGFLVGFNPSPGTPSGDYLPLSNYIYIDRPDIGKSWYVAFTGIQYNKSYNYQYDFYQVRIRPYFKVIDSLNGTPDNFTSFTSEYLSVLYTPVEVTVAGTSSNFYDIFGSIVTMQTYHFNLYNNSGSYQFLTDYNNLSIDQKMVADKFFTWQQLLDSPVCTLDFATIDWQPVESATSYIIYKDNEYYITVTDSQFVTVVNGSYYVVAIDSTGTYGDSTNSNTINVTVYNDNVGNGTNFFSLFSSIIDAQLYLFRSMLDWNILGINLLTLFKIILTIFLIVLVIKFILGRK